MIHRGLIISIIQAAFSIIFYFVAIPVYNGFLMLGYATVYTMLPVFSLVLDYDVSEEQALEYPPLYKTLQKGRALTLKTFLIWVWFSIYQGAWIMLASIALFNDSFANIVTITFSALIIIELANVYSSVNHLTFLMFLSILVTIIVYAGSIIMFNNYFDTSYMTLSFLWKILVIAIAAWFPVHAGIVIYECIDPPEEKKIRSGAK